MQYFTVALFASQFYPVCNFGKFVNFGLGTVKSERGNATVASFVLLIKFRCGILTKIAQVWHV